MDRDMDRNLGEEWKEAIAKDRRVFSRKLSVVKISLPDSVSERDNLESIDLGQLEKNRIAAIFEGNKDLYFRICDKIGRAHV